MQGKRVDSRARGLNSKSAYSYNLRSVISRSVGRQNGEPSNRQLMQNVPIDLVDLCFELTERVEMNDVRRDYNEILLHNV